MNTGAGETYAKPIKGYRVPMLSEAHRVARAACTHNSGVCPVHSVCDGGCPPVGQAPAVGIVRID